MFDKVMAFLNSLSGESQGVELDSTTIAVIALALNVVQADGVIQASETETLESVIRAYFNLSKGEFDQMLAAARKEVDEASERLADSATYADPAVVRELVARHNAALDGIGELEATERRLAAELDAASAAPARA